MNLKSCPRFAAASPAILAAAAAMALSTAMPVRAQDANSNAEAKPSQSYTTVTDIKVTPLSNGVQIKISADGILQFRQDSYADRLKAVTINFPDARNGLGKNFLNVNRYPVSHIALSTPQGAKNGIGLSFVVNNFAESAYSIAQTADSQGVLVTILSDRTIEGANHKTVASATEMTKNGGVDTATTVTFTGGKLSLRAVNADVHSLISAIAEKTGLNVAVDDAVDRKVSLNLRDDSPESAIQSIATANGLALSRIGDMLILSEGVPTDLATYRVSGTESYRMQNTQAATASGLLPNFLYSYVKVNPEQNAVVVTAPSQMLAKIGRDLSAVDTPSPEIAIEAVAVEFTEDTNISLGLLLTDQRSTSVSSLNTPAGQISYNSVGLLPQNFALTLQALVQSGKARVRARPRMAVVNGKTANIFIGSQKFILTQFNSYGQTQTRIQPVDVGVKLNIMPLTGGNGEITTTIAPEVSNITEQDAQTGLPVLSTRNASTTVRVRDGETIVIGGLSLDQDEMVSSKIPLLGDIPLLGNLFRSKTQNSVRTELVIFVTPRIVTSEVDAAGGGTVKK